MLAGLPGTSKFQKSCDQNSNFLTCPHPTPSKVTCCHHHGHPTPAPRSFHTACLCKRQLLKHPSGEDQKQPVTRTACWKWGTRGRYLTRIRPDRGEISFLKEFPICAAAKGNFPWLNSKSRLKFRKIPCAVSGLKYL